jgi:very-short-patch-repair endonuclease
MEIQKYNPKLRDRARELRKKSTYCEIVLWQYLKQQKLGVRFLRQRPIDNYIVDFYCKEFKLAIEIDGLIHHNQIIEDKFRQGQLEALGISFLRFTNEEIEKDILRVIQVIKEKINTHRPSGTSLEGGTS